ncbi:hypothetical protein, partial [Nonlabens ulvanivorans]
TNNQHTKGLRVPAKTPHSPYTFAIASNLKTKIMKKLIYIFTILSFLISHNLFAKDKLITIYDKDCGFSQELLNDTYQNDLVKKELSSYEHLIFEADTDNGINYINEFNITAFPTQIIISDDSIISFAGYYDSKNQLQILKEPKQFNTVLIAYNSELSEQDGFIPDMVIKYLCTTMNNANASSRSSLEAFMTAFQSMLDKMEIKVDDLNKYTFENIDKLICTNKDTVKMRKTNTILKHAIDTANYKFIREAIFIKVDGKNVCNPYIDFNRVEIIDGEEETLIQFIDKLLNEDGMDAAHDFNTIRDIENQIQGCINAQNNKKL